MARKAKAAEPLAEYVRKRDFTATPEPKGSKRSASTALRFVVQKHHASRLHYDFRLEAGGVLASWAIPKGPTLDTRERRLAMHVEDHPYDYRTFEGIIPAGNYGAGEVIVWDEGTYTLAEGTDPAAEIGKGKIKFIMHGKKLHGMFTLVKIKGKGGQDGDPWLLIKDKDEYVDPGVRYQRAPRKREDRSDARGHRRQQNGETVEEQSRGRASEETRGGQAGQGRSAAARSETDARNAGRCTVRRSGVALRSEVGRLSRDRRDRCRRNGHADVAQRARLAQTVSRAVVAGYGVSVAAGGRRRVRSARSMRPDVRRFRRCSKSTSPRA